MFSRVYSGLFLIVLFAAAVCAGLYQWSLSARVSQHERNALSGVMQLVTDTVQRQSPDTRAQYLDIVASLMGGTHAARTLTTLDSAGQVLLQAGRPLRLPSDGDLMQWCLPDTATTCINLSLAPLSEQHYRATAILFVSELSRRSAAITVSALQAYTPARLSAGTLGDVPVDAQQRSRLRNGSVVVVSDRDNADRFAVYAPLPDQRVLRMEGLRRFTPLTSGTVLAMLCAVGLIVGVGCFALVKALERQLASLNSSLTRFGEGDLASRVPVPAESGTRPDAIARLGRHFNAMAEKVQALVEAERSLLRAVSHELRTPVARMRFRLEALTPDVAPAAGTPHIDGLRDDMDAMQGLIDELLTYNRIDTDAARADRRACVVDELVRDVVPPLAALYPGVAVQTALDASHPVLLDAKRFERVISNLVDNALKYTESQVRVTTRQSGNTVQLTVEDDGPGIAVGDRDRVFDVFYRAESNQSQGVPGYGIGLATVKRVVEQHGGRLEVSASDWGGAAVSVFLGESDAVGV